MGEESEQELDEIAAAQEAAAEQAAEDAAAEDAAAEAEEAEASSGSIPGSGTYEVGVDVEPGTYKNDGPTNDAFCVAYTSTKPADLGSYIRGSTSEGPGIVTIEDGEFFSTEFCQDWTKQ